MLAEVPSLVPAPMSCQVVHNLLTLAPRHLQPNSSAHTIPSHPPTHESMFQNNKKMFFKKDYEQDKVTQAYNSNTRGAQTKAL